MSYWPWWLGGLALAGVLVLHWVFTRRLLAVSGRYTALINRLRFGKRETLEKSDTNALAEALRLATLEQFGTALETAIEEEPPPPVKAPAEKLPPQTTTHHTLFFVGMVAGGLVSALTGSGLEPASLNGSLFASVFGQNPWVCGLTLFSGGLLVGFGTRMASGCTTGHGLCGSSRFQPSSLAATASFFGAAVATAMLIGVLT